MVLGLGKRTTPGIPYFTCLLLFHFHILIIFAMLYKVWLYLVFVLRLSETLFPFFQFYNDCSLYYRLAVQIHVFHYNRYFNSNLG